MGLRNQVDPAVDHSLDILLVVDRSFAEVAEKDIHLIQNGGL